MTENNNPSSRTLRHALVGVGANVFSMHRAGLDLPTTEIVGLFDINREVANKVSNELGCVAYPDLESMLADAQPDIVVVMTPHPHHAEQSIAALKAGAHVLVEKPLAVHVAEADSMIRTAEETGKFLAVNFQQRLRPEIVTAHRLIQEGGLGKIQHVDIKITWTRTNAYYTASPWRGTWAGEGGAVLMNQGPHELDLLCHLVGMPSQVFGWTRTILHKIEAEDTFQAMLEWSDGALGSLHISTAESGQPQRFEILGTAGRLEIAPGSLRYQRFDSDLRDFIPNHPAQFAAPSMSEVPVDLAASTGNHRSVWENLHSAILHGTPLIAPASTAIHGLELANAINYSSHTGQVVRFPLDRQAYADLLADLRARANHHSD